MLLVFHRIVYPYGEGRHGAADLSALCAGSRLPTTFTFNNLSPGSTEVALDFYSQSGVLTESASVPLPGFGSGTYGLSGTALTIGWARADFTGAADVAVTETIQTTNTAGGLSVEASVFAAQPDAM